MMRFLPIEEGSYILKYQVRRQNVEARHQKKRVSRLET